MFYLVLISKICQCHHTNPIPEPPDPAHCGHHPLAAIALAPHIPEKPLRPTTLICFHPGSALFGRTAKPRPGVGWERLSGVPERDREKGSSWDSLSRVQGEPEWVQMGP